MLVCELVGTRAPGARFEARVEARANRGPHFSGGGWWGPPKALWGRGRRGGAETVEASPVFWSVSYSAREQGGLR